MSSLLEHSAKKQRVEWQQGDDLMGSDQQGQKVTLTATIDTSISRLWIDTFGLRPLPKHLHHISSNKDAAAKTQKSP